MNNYIIISHMDITNPMKDIFIRENVMMRKSTCGYETDMMFKDLSEVSYKDFSTSVEVEYRNKDLEPYQFSCAVGKCYSKQYDNKKAKTFVTRYRTLYKQLYENLLTNDVNYAKGIYLSRIVSHMELEYVYNAFGHLFHNSIKDMYFHSNNHRFYNMETLEVSIIDDVKLNQEQESKFNTLSNKMTEYEKHYKYNIALNIQEVQKKEIMQCSTINMHINNSISM